MTTPKIRTLEPNFCPLHGQNGPCMYCLTPEVANLVRLNSKEEVVESVLFQQIDQNIN